MRTYLAVCIDDDEDFLRSLEGSLPERVARLCPQFRCDFEFVSSPAELQAVLQGAAARGVQPALVISDQLMPQVRGMDLVEQLKAERPELVCVLLTGHAALDSAQHAINHHLLDQYVFKPIQDLQEFALLVGNLLKQYHLALEERLRTEQLAQTSEELQASNEKIRQMLAAAEQVAMLSKSFKSLDFSEVVELTTQKVPELFEADWAVLCFNQEHCPLGPVRRRNCPCPTQELSDRPDARQAIESGRAACGTAPETCRRLGGRSPDVVIPLSAGGPVAEDGQPSPSSYGYLCMCNLLAERAGGRDLLQYKAKLIGEILSASLTNARLYQQARRDSQTDSLTGVYSRRAVERHLEAECERSVRYARPFSVLMLDVDRLKSVNDRLGHAAGDQALRKVAEMLAGEIRSSDVLGRFGGDEFVVLMPETGSEAALAAAERMRQRVQKALGEAGVTLSCGVALGGTGAEAGGADVLRQADAALYRAKRSGRNRVELAADQPAPAER